MQELLTLSAQQLAHRIRTGQVSSRAVVEAHIERQRAVNDTLNAVVANRYAEALQEADAADEILRRAQPDQPLPPLLGVPCSIKECFALTGMPQTSGLLARKGYRSTQDAPTVARLRAAGAIPLGVTNVSELCMWMESTNKVYGRTRNPYNPSRIVGGSSGGEGAIIAAGGAPFGLGSDVGGSIRMPAFFCGVFGHKPSGGLVPNTGQYPDGEGKVSGYLCTGPLARRAEDLWPLLDLLAGPDGQDPGCKPMLVGRPDKVDWAKVTVYVVRSSGAWYTRPVQGDLHQAQDRAAAALQALGAKVEPLEVPRFAEALWMWSAALRKGGAPTFASIMGLDRPMRLLSEFLKLPFGRSRHTYMALMLALVETPPSFLLGLDKTYLRWLEDLTAEMNQRLQSAVLLYPPYPAVAPAHQWPQFTRTLDWTYTGLFNALQLPVTQVPTGLNAQGLPTGVQVASAHGNDHLTVAAAEALETALGGWVWPGALGG